MVFSPISDCIYAEKPISKSPTLKFVLSAAFSEGVCSVDGAGTDADGDILLFDIGISAPPLCYVLGLFITLLYTLQFLRSLPPTLQIQCFRRHK